MSRTTAGDLGTWCRSDPWPRLGSGDQWCREARDGHLADGLGMPGEVVEDFEVLGYVIESYKGYKWYEWYKWYKLHYMSIHKYYTLQYFNNFTHLSDVWWARFAPNYCITFLPREGCEICCLQRRSLDRDGMAEHIRKHRSFTSRDWSF